MAKGRKRGSRFFKNSIEETKARLGRRRRDLLAQSNHTGIRHRFENLEAWEEISSDMERGHIANLEQVLLASLPFARHLSGVTLDTKLISVACPEVLYRYANPKYGPLAVEGSLAHGGRFNIGGAQMSPQFPSLKPRACLYAASTAACATAEVAQPLGVYKMHELRPKSRLVLWDLSAVIQTINYPNLLDEVKRTPVDALWGYQKIPTISQILAEHLRDLGGDGIAFESVKHPPDLNIAVFVQDAAHAQKIFNALLIST